MVGERTFPGLGLQGGFDIGSAGWGDVIDENNRVLSVVNAGHVTSRTTEPASSGGFYDPPATGDEGLMYILPSGAGGQDNAVMVWDEEHGTGTGQWVSYYPKNGWMFWVDDEDQYVFWQDSVGWQPLGVNLAGGSDVTVNSQTGAAYSAVADDFDGSTVVWMNNADANVLTVPSGLSVSRPMQVVMGGAGQTSISGGSGVTFYGADSAFDLRVQYSVASVIPIAADEYLIVGDLFDASA